MIKTEFKTLWKDDEQLICKVKRDSKHSIFRTQIVSLEFHRFQLQNPKQTSASTAISRGSTNKKAGQT